MSTEKGQFNPFDDPAFQVKFTQSAGEVFNSAIAEEKLANAKSSALNTTARLLQLVINTPGALLIKLGFLASVSVFWVSLLGLWQFSSAWWKVSLVLSLLAIVFVTGFAWRRKDLLKRIAKEQATVISSAGAQVILQSASSEDDWQAFARRQGESVAAVRAEFNTRLTRFMPRVEASQRALRQLAGGAFEGSWLDHDLRPTIVFFVGAFLSMPVMIFTAILSFFVLVFGG